MFNLAEKTSTNTLAYFYTDMPSINILGYLNTDLPMKNTLGYLSIDSPRTNTLVYFSLDLPLPWTNTLAYSFVASNTMGKHNCLFVPRPLNTRYNQSSLFVPRTHIVAFASLCHTH